MRITRWGEGVRAIGRSFYVWDEDDRELRQWAGELCDTERSRVQLEERRRFVVRLPPDDPTRRSQDPRSS